MNMTNWIPAPSTLLRIDFAGMTRSDNQQSIKLMSIISVSLLTADSGTKGIGKMCWHWSSNSGIICEVNESDLF